MVKAIKREADNKFLVMTRQKDWFESVERWSFSCDQGHPDFITTVFNGDFGRVRCPICSEELRAEEDREKARREWRKVLVQRHGVPADSAMAVLDGFRIREEEGKQVAFEDSLALNGVRSLAETGGDPYTAVRNVTICGKTGVGKTFLGAALVSQVAHAGESAFMIQDSALLSQVLACGRGKGAESDQLRKRFEEYQVLVIDDLDHERWARANCAFLADLIIARFGAMKQTLILTNRTPAELLPAFGSAVESRLKRGRVITVTGEDRRKSQKLQEVAG